MAQNIHNLLRITSNVLTKNIARTAYKNGIRMLYSESALGLDGYKKSRQNVQMQFADMSDKFREKMKVYAEDTSSSMIFTEDLKNMLFLVNDSTEDMKLLLKMMIKFHSQNSQMRFGSFVFGPVVMRTYYFLNQVDEALAAFHNPQLDGFFDQQTSFQLLMDMLHNHGKFAELRQIYENLKTKPAIDHKRPTIIMLGGCFKENTPDSMNYAVDLWQSLKSKGTPPVRRSVTFFAGLALNQGRPDITAEVISSVRDFNYVTIRNLKVAALAELDRLDDILPIFRISLSNDNIATSKQTYTEDVIGRVEAAIKRLGLSTDSAIVHMIRRLRENDHVVHTALDSIIGSEIAHFVINSERQFGNYNNQRFPNQRYQNQRYNNYDDAGSNQPYTSRSAHNPRQRLGLKDLV